MSVFRTVRPDERLVVFRLGKTNQNMVRGPGRAIVLPVIERAVVVDMRKRSVSFGELTAATSDGRAIRAVVNVDFRVVDPLRFVVNIVDVTAGLERLAVDELRAVARDLTLDEALDRHQLEEPLRTRVERVGSRWGLRVESVVLGGLVEVPRAVGTTE